MHNKNESFEHSVPWRKIHGLAKLEQIMMVSIKSKDPGKRPWISLLYEIGVLADMECT
jgi:hypothetical protein